MPRSSVAGTSADPIPEYVTLKLDEVEYRLILDFNAIAEAEDLVPGCDLMTSLAHWMKNKATLKDRRALFFAALHRYQPDMTLEATGKLMQPADLGDIMVALVGAYNISVSKKNKLILNSE